MSFVLEKIKSVIVKLPLGNFILFESRPDFADNSKYVYEELSSRKFKRKYRYVWACNDDVKLHKRDNLIFVKRNSFLYIIFRIRARALISSNLCLEPFSDKQLSIFLAHGTAVKKVGKYYKLPDNIRYCLASSKNTVNLRSVEFGIPEDRIVPLGFPRNDSFAQNPIDLHYLFDVDYKKIVVWYPTFRQHIDGVKTGAENALPLIWDLNNAKKLNDFCERENILIVIKPHFIQDMSFISILKLSRLLFVNDSFFETNNISPYSFIGNCDAMLTDYSSVYFDYTLCDKPIGLIWEDYEKYEANPGFAVDMNYMMKGGYKIYNISDMTRFLMDVCNETDVLADARREIRDYMNCSNDGCNTIRVVDFIVDKAGLEI